MKRFLRIVRAVAIALAVFLAAVFLLNTSWLAPAPTGKPLLIAHRGAGQTFHREGLTGTTCTAQRIFPPENPWIENTIAGFRAAFDAGADMIEFDVHPTTDGHFVVFHDWTLDCRTDGHGVTREQALPYLKSLDVGYGYTSDGGKTFPFRGKGVGQMPTLDEVLAAFPDEHLLINIKSDDAAEGERLAARLAALEPAQREHIEVYGGGRAIAEVSAALPDMRVLGTDGARKCLIRYAALGWFGIVPEQCRNTLFMLPVNYAPFFAGFPNRLTARLGAHGTKVVLLGAYDGSGFSSGVDTVEELDRVPAEFDGMVWTNRIDRIGPALAAR